jgi:hypothetical protein
VFHRPRSEVHLFEKGEKHGTVGAKTQIIPWGDQRLKEIIPKDLFEQLEVSQCVKASKCMEALLDCTHKNL